MCIVLPIPQKRRGDAVVIFQIICRKILHVKCREQLSKGANH